MVVVKERRSDRARRLIHDRVTSHVTRAIESQVRLGHSSNSLHNILDYSSSSMYVCAYMYIRKTFGPVTKRNVHLLARSLSAPSFFSRPTLKCWKTDSASVPSWQRLKAFHPAYQESALTRTGSSEPESSTSTRSVLPLA